MKAVSIIGLGWLGLPLADLFIQKGYSVAGTTTSSHHQSIIAHTSLTVECFNIYNDEPSALPQDFFAGSTLVLNIPPGRKSFESNKFVSRLQALISHAFANKLEQLIFISTTSVFGNAHQTITNQSAVSPTTESAKAHVRIENYIRSKYYHKSCIVRPSGLVGPNNSQYLRKLAISRQFRHPIFSMVNRENLDTGDNPVNLIHQADLIKVIAVICDTNLSEQSLNVSALSHPSRKEYYTWCAKQLNLPAPNFSTSLSTNCENQANKDPASKKPASYKLIDARESFDILGITPAYPSPFDMLPNS